jgi:hypothetical protein
MLRIIPRFHLGGKGTLPDKAEQIGEAMVGMGPELVLLSP